MEGMAPTPTDPAGRPGTWPEEGGSRRGTHIQGDSLSLEVLERGWAALGGTVLTVAAHGHRVHGAWVNFHWGGAGKKSY